MNQPKGQTATNNRASCDGTSPKSNNMLRLNHPKGKTRETRDQPLGQLRFFPNPKAQKHIQHLGRWVLPLIPKTTGGYGSKLNQQVMGPQVFWSTFPIARILIWGTLPPTIMEVDRGALEDTIEIATRSADASGQSPINKLQGDSSLGSGKRRLFA